MTLKKNYLNSIGTDSLIASDNEEGTSFTSTGKTTIRYYYHTDQLGSVIAISTGTGLVAQKYSYNIHGKPYVSIGNALYPLSSYTGTLYGNSRLYTGREFENDTGYYYNRARYLSSDLGRFISRDPIGQNDQVNLYTYVKNSPLNYTDRDGKKASAMLGNVWSNLINTALYVGSFSYELVDNQSFGLLNAMVGGYDRDNVTDAEWNAKDAADKVSMNLNTLLIGLGISGQVGGSTSIAVGFSSCIPTAGGGCVAGFAGVAVDAASAGVTSYGLANTAYMLAKQKNGGTPKQAQQKQERGQAPRDVGHIDEPEGSVPGSQWHAHDKKNGGAFNQDGSIHDLHRGYPQIGNKGIDWLNNHGWDIKK